MFGSLLRDMERDPIFGAHSRAMSQMMNSMFGDFGFGGSPFGGMGMDIMPFGMPMHRPFISPFSQMNAMTADLMNPETMMSRQMDTSGPSFSHSQVSYMTMTPGANGRPQIYQASTTTRHGPGGVRETRKAVSDSRTGTKKVHHGRHLGDRAHIREREENLVTGHREEHEDLVNLDHEEKEVFDREWRSRVYGGGYEPRSITAGPSVQEEMPSNSGTYRHGVTIQEVHDDDEEAGQETLALPSAPTVQHPPSPSRRHLKDRRQKSSSKRTKRYH